MPWQLNLAKNVQKRVFLEGAAQVRARSCGLFNFERQRYA